MAFFDAAFTAGRRAVRLLDLDPDLAAGGADGAAALSLTTTRLRAGRWTPASIMRDDLRALLIVDGVLVRTVRVGSQCRSELLGEGDVICPDEAEHALSTVEFTVEWEVLQPARVGLLDDAFFAMASRWPAVAAALTVRGIRRSQRLALQLAIDDLRRVDARMIALLLHLGDRWGRMTPQGIHIPLRLTHELLAQLLGAQRPTVTTSLNDLARTGRLLRRRDRTWVVCDTSGLPASSPMRARSQPVGA